MIYNPELNKKIQKETLNGVKVPHSTSYPVIRKENNEWYLATFTFFFTKEDIEKGEVDNPSCYTLYDIKTGELIKTYHCEEQNFTNVPNEKHNIRIDKNDTRPNKYFDLALTYLDRSRDSILNGNFDEISYQTYLDMILVTVSKDYQCFYLDLSIAIENNNKIKEYLGMSDQEKLEKYINDNCNRLYIPYSEFECIDFFSTVKVFYLSGTKKESNPPVWTFQKTNQIDDDTKSTFAFTTYESAYEYYIEKKCDGKGSYNWRVDKKTISEGPYSSKWILVLINSKGNAIRIMDDTKINPQIILNYYKRIVTPENPVNEYKELATINVSNVIDWLLSLQPDMQESQLEKTAENLLKYSDISLAIQHHIEYDSFDNNIFIAGYTANKLHEEVGEKLSVIGVYNYLVTLKEQPEQGLEWLRQGLPRK